MLIILKYALLKCFRKKNQGFVQYIEHDSISVVYVCVCVCVIQTERYKKPANVVASSGRTGK